MLRLFSQNNPFVLFFIPIIVALYRGLDSLTGGHHIQNSYLGLWGKINVSEYNILNFLIPVSIISFCAIELNRLFNKEEFFEKNNHLPSLIFVVFSSFFSPLYFVNRSLFSLLFLLLTLRQLFRLRQKEDARAISFNTGFLFGMTCTFTPLMTFAVPLIITTLLIVRPFVVREFLLLLLGFITPWIYLLSFVYVFQVDLSSLLYEVLYTDYEILTYVLITVSFGLLFFILSVAKMMKRVSSSSIRFRKIIRQLIVFSLILFLVAFTDSFIFLNKNSIFLLVIPLSLTSIYVFTDKGWRRIVASILFYTFFLISVSKFFFSINKILF